jgi:hypothetical protein
LSVPGPITAEIDTTAAEGALNEPQGASRSHDHAQGVGSHHPLPCSTLVFSKAIQGVGVTTFDLHHPPLIVCMQDGLGAQGQIGAEKGFNPLQGAIP